MANITTVFRQKWAKSKAINCPYQFTFVRKCVNIAEDKQTNK